jgi:amino acid adenylation domain-containing protein
VTDPRLENRVRPTNPFIEFRREEIEQSLSERFEQIVRKHPTAIAVKTERQTVTYDALNKEANRLAWAILSQRNAATREPAAVLVEQGPQAIAALFGVLKSGRIYVPVDPGHARARAACMLEDSQASLIVTNERNLPLAQELSTGKTPLIVLEQCAGFATEELQDSRVAPDDAACIMYTSGSTGQPKGIVHCHRGLLHDCLRRTNLLHLGPADRWTLLSSGTSQTLKNVLGALLNGGSLHPLDVKKEGAGVLADFLIREDITIYYSVATLFREFLSVLADGKQFPRLRLFYVGSEPVYRHDFEVFQKRFAPHCLLVNTLSASETGAICHHLVDGQSRIESNTVPVGYPLQDMKVLLLDDAGKETAANEVGEIVVESPFLSLGYWRRLDLTQKAFQPSANGSEARVYRTGDLGRWLPDGSLEYVGRKDFQVKIRGYRVEVSEIELALQACHRIKQAMVVGREDLPGQQQLVAYVVPAGSTTLTSAELRRLLAHRLPDYMIPAAFVLLDSFPLLPSGKVDCAALTAPGPERPELSNTYAPPRNPIETTLACIWAEVLGLEQVGIHDSFLELGGNSLQAGRIIARAVRTFGVELRLDTLFQSPTVAAMSQLVTHNLGSQGNATEIANMITALQSLSAEEARELLAEESPR